MDIANYLLANYPPDIYPQSTIPSPDIYRRTSTPGHLTPSNYIPPPPEN